MHIISQMMSCQTIVSGLLQQILTGNVLICLLEECAAMQHEIRKLTTGVSGAAAVVVVAAAHAALPVAVSRAPYRTCRQRIAVSCSDEDTCTAQAVVYCTACLRRLSSI